MLSFSPRRAMPATPARTPSGAPPTCLLAAAHKRSRGPTASLRLSVQVLRAAWAGKRAHSRPRHQPDSLQREGGWHRVRLHCMCAPRRMRAQFATVASRRRYVLPVYANWRLGLRCTRWQSFELACRPTRRPNRHPASSEELYYTRARWALSHNHGDQQLGRGDRCAMLLLCRQRTSGRRFRSR